MHWTHHDIPFKLACEPADARTDGEPVDRHGRTAPLGRDARKVALAVGGSLGLVSVVIGSFALRAIASMTHVAPTLFPDEYIYTALGRSLAQSGRPLIRGEAAHFPALLAPILAAPIWATVSSTTVAYHAIQAENAFLMSLAAVPVFLIARWLGLSRNYALFTALVTIASPDLTFSGYMLSEPVAYPLVLTALYLGMRALERPTLARQAAFLATAGAASFARAQYVVLVPSFLVAAALISRRRTLRTHTLPFALVGAGLAVIAVVGAANVLGYYSAVTGLHLGFGLVRWAIVDALLLSFAAGVVIVPGAVIGFASARGSREIPCAVLSGTYAAALLVAAALYASNGSGRFQERYLFSLLPLLPIGFGLYLRHAKRGAWVVTIAAAAVIALVALAPISPYVAGTGVTDSPTLRGVARIEEAYGVGMTSLGVAMYVTFAAAIAAIFAWRRSAWPVLALTLAFLVISSATATAFDAADSRRALESTSASDPRWVDQLKLRDVTAVRAAAAPPGPLLEQLAFNRSITREALLPGASPTDSFSTMPVHVASDGTLLSPAGAVRTPILLDRYGITADFDNARLMEETARFALWKPHGIPRFRYLEQGRYRDGWLAPSGRLTLYSPKSKPLRGVVMMTLTAAPGGGSTAFRIGDTRLLLAAGVDRQLAYCVDSHGPWSVAFAGVAHFLRDSRAVTVHSSVPRFRRGAACTPDDPRP